MRSYSLAAIVPTLSVVVACASAGCAVATDVSPDQLEENTEAAEGAVSTPSGDAVTSTATCTTAQNPVLDLLCKLPGASCTAKSCKSTSTDFEVFTGVTNKPPTNVAPKDVHTNGYGARGRRIGEAGLCLLKDLANTEAKAQALPNHGFSATQRVGFESFSKTTKTVKAWRQMQVCAPFFGCVNPPTQRITATLVDSASAGKMLGNLPVLRSYGLLFHSEGQSNSTNFSLPSFPIYTPIGPLTVTPSATYKANMPALTGSKTHTPLYVRGLAPVPGPAEWWMGDTAGRYPGEAIESVLASSPTSAPTGWVSQIAFGTRGSGDVWVPVSGEASRNHGRPDLELSRARTIPEAGDSAVLTASANVSYNFKKLLPKPLLSGPFNVTQATVWVKPTIRGEYQGQFDVVAAESMNPVIDVADSRENLAQIRMPSSVSVNGSVEVAVGLDLVIKVDTPFGDVTVVDVHPKAGAPLAEWPATKAAKTAGTSMLRWGESPAVNTSQGPYGTMTYVDEGTYGPMTTWSGSTISNPQQFVQQCLSQDPPSKPVPGPAYTAPNPADVQPLVEFPCNVCVNVAPQPGTSVSGPMTVLPSTSNPLPASKQWACDSYGGQLGCMDLCVYDPATGATTVKHSATEIVSAQCSAAYRVK